MAMFQNKKKFHMSLVKTLLSYNFHEEVIDFLKGHWEKEKLFFSRLFFNLSGSKSWRKINVQLYHYGQKTPTN